MKLDYINGLYGLYGPRCPQKGCWIYSLTWFLSLMGLLLLWSQNSGFRLFCSKVSYTHWSYFQICVQYGPQRPNFWSILDPKISKNSGRWSLSEKVFTGFTSVLLHKLIASTFSGVWNMSLRGPILGPKTSQNSGLWSSFHWFHISIAIGIDTNIEVIVVSLTTWEAHHSPRAKPNKLFNCTIATIVGFM